MGTSLAELLLVGSCFTLPCPGLRNSLILDSACYFAASTVRNSNTISRGDIDSRCRALLRAIETLGLGKPENHIVQLPSQLQDFTQQNRKHPSTQQANKSTEATYQKSSRVAILDKLEKERQRQRQEGKGRHKQIKQNPANNSAYPYTPEANYLNNRTANSYKTQSSEGHSNDHSYTSLNEIRNREGSNPLYGRRNAGNGQFGSVSIAERSQLATFAKRKEPKQAGEESNRLKNENYNTSNLQDGMSLNHSELNRPEYRRNPLGNGYETAGAQMSESNRDQNGDTSARMIQLAVNLDSVFPSNAQKNTSLKQGEVYAEARNHQPKGHTRIKSEASQAHGWYRQPAEPTNPPKSIKKTVEVFKGVPKTQTATLIPFTEPQLPISHAARTNARHGSILEDESEEVNAEEEDLKEELSRIDARLEGFKTNLYPSTPSTINAMATPKAIGANMPFVHPKISINRFNELSAAKGDQSVYQEEAHIAHTPHIQQIRHGNGGPKLVRLSLSPFNKKTPSKEQTPRANTKKMPKDQVSHGASTTLNKTSSVQNWKKGK